MAKKISFGSVDLRAMKAVAIHSLDHAGHLSGTVVADFGGQRHAMTVKVSYASCCGGLDEEITCSCGHKSKYFDGRSCWACGHYPTIEHTMDAAHAALYELASRETPTLNN